MFVMCRTMAKERPNYLKLILCSSRSLEILCVQCQILRRMKVFWIIFSYEIRHIHEKAFEIPNSLHTLYVVQTPRNILPVSSIKNPLCKRQNFKSMYVRFTLKVLSLFEHIDNSFRFNVELSLQ